MDLLTGAILAWFGLGGIIGVVCVLIIALCFLAFVSLILWLFYEWTVGAIVTFWVLCFTLPLFWKYIHDKEEREQREKKDNSQSNTA